MRFLIRNTAVIAFFCVTLSACKVGPNFRAPSAPPVKHYTERPFPKKTVSSQSPGGNAQIFLSNTEIPFLWWELFHSKAINQLIKTGLANNPSIASAKAAVKQAQEQVNVQIGNSMLPSLKTVDTAQRQRYSTQNIGGASFSPTFSLFNPLLSASYNLDLFGGSRRQIESLKAQVDYQQFELLAAYLTLTSNIVTTAVNVASYQAQIDATVALINEEQRIYSILSKQYKLGGVAQTDVLTQQTILEQTKATLPVLQKNRAIAQHALSALVGTFPDRPLPQINLNSLRLPTNIPISIPSKLVQQRPDIRAAEALMHSACAQIGVATANLLPQISLSSGYGWLNTSVTDLFIPQNVIWNALSQVTQPIFQGGALFANRRALIATYQQVDAQYRQTVLTAFQSVADSLRALEADARALQAEALAESAASRALKLTLSQYQLGATTYINLLTAQHQYRQAQLNRIRAQAVRLTDTVALFQSLGGGWWQTPNKINH
jgi:NodT family efflux transporter outer membrane factor (OMF) lipoprotein